jgi:hypothetical protein
MRGPCPFRALSDVGAHNGESALPLAAPPNQFASCGIKAVTLPRWSATMSSADSPLSVISFALVWTRRKVRARHSQFAHGRSGEFGDIPLQARPRSPDRSRSPVAVSRKREYFKYPPETIGDLAPATAHFGPRRPIANSQKPPLARISEVTEGKVSGHRTGWHSVSWNQNPPPGYQASGSWAER